MARLVSVLSLIAMASVSKQMRFYTEGYVRDVKLLRWHPAVFTQAGTFYDNCLRDLGLGTRITAIEYYMEQVKGGYYSLIEFR